jgi:hypothetical protein
MMDRLGFRIGRLAYATGLALAIVSLGGCASESSGTFGPYAADAYGRTDCSFSTRIENGGVCPRIPIPVIPVAGVTAPDHKTPEKGCSLWDYASNTFVCPAPEVPPGEDVTDAPPTQRYCYRTLAGTECYDQPTRDPNRHPVVISPNAPLSPGTQPH